MKLQDIKESRRPSRMTKRLHLSQGENHPMKTESRKTTPLGELVAAVFDQAARYTTDSRRMSHLAAQAVAHMLRYLSAPVSLSLPPLGASK